MSATGERVSDHYIVRAWILALWSVLFWIYSIIQTFHLWTTKYEGHGGIFFMLGFLCWREYRRQKSEELRALAHRAGELT